MNTEGVDPHVQVRDEDGEWSRGTVACEKGDEMDDQL